MVRIFQENDYDGMSQRAACFIASEVYRDPACVLGLATGSTVLGTYERLTRWNRSGYLSFRDVHTVNLDEYRGLPSAHEQSYRHYMRVNLFANIDIDSAHTHIPNGMAEDPEAECAAYDELLSSLGYADMQLLGLGRNGHIGFNEPGDCFIRETHTVDLSQSTIEANARFFDTIRAVPRQALTMGIGGIMSARRILLLACGADKSEALYRALCGPITPECPASVLQLHHHVVVIGDKTALKKVADSGLHFENKT